ncbi:hypothetical protein J1605_014039 [Eschrichtius robustus]|uniref:Uncharacterized protein n=1 Tax=Eschrichtius robustus TaxID=9764 RepID=A0AB34GHR1_ESCRO|nr:hypothetical protein J1605_014039 [Eschrichtius robustus]
MGPILRVRIQGWRVATATSGKRGLLASHPAPQCIRSVSLAGVPGVKRESRLRVRAQAVRDLCGLPPRVPGRTAPFPHPLAVPGSPGRPAPAAAAASIPTPPGPFCLVISCPAEARPVSGAAGSARTGSPPDPRLRRRTRGERGGEGGRDPVHAS